ncbi:cell surface glycoprotein MUC18 isoform X1 [Lepisosteus oculatus]|uniref:cell surface glycoprotein MUC18 isoform X1 n=2 Tax=Lepisosteus oculatus TaxID=7918 RepID=UPI00073FE1DF|nr:PREDICTED: cell surface glycoprotein MUC18 isoform X1 [Lepisosteus oculatus]
MALLKTTSSVLVLCSVFATLQVSALVMVTMKDQVEVFQGDTAHIPCRATFSKTPSAVHVQWFVRGSSSRERIYFKDRNVSVADNGTGYTGRISIGDDNTLTIADVQLRDARDFICQVGGMSAGKGENRTELKVYVTPEFPVIEGSHSGFSVTSDEQSEIASCEVRNGYPQPNVTWYRNHSPLHPHENQITVVPQVTKESNELFSVKSSLLYKVSKEDKDATFYCEVTYSAPGSLKMVESERINITVHYPTTKVELVSESPQGLIKEGDTVKLRCRGDGNPPPQYTFYSTRSTSTEETELKSQSDLLTLEEVARTDSGLYQCKTLDLDTFEELTANLEILVHYLDPVVLKPSDTVIAVEGDRLIVSCNALSSLKTQVVWKKKGESISAGNTLTLTEATFDTAGEYVCEVSVPELPGLEKSASLMVLVQGIPRLNMHPETEIEETVGKFVNLTCEARAYPQPKIHWVISGTQDWREVFSHAGEQHVVSVVTVRVTSGLQAACNASNEAGFEEHLFAISATPLVTTSTAPSTTVTKSREKIVKKEGSGVIIAVIIVCILLLAILGSVLYFLYKKGRIPCGRSGKQDITKEKTTKDDIVVEMKAEKPAEETVLLQGVNGEKKPPSDQCEKYIDLRN